MIERDISYDVDNKEECFLCGRNGYADPLQKHHIYGGRGRRKKSEKYHLYVYICGDRCHETGKHAVQNDPAVAKYLHQWGQRKAMQEQGWTVDQFRQEFGQNYLDEV